MYKASAPKDANATGVYANEMFHVSGDASSGDYTDSYRYDSCYARSSFRGRVRACTSAYPPFPDTDDFRSTRRVPAQ